MFIYIMQLSTKAEILQKVQKLNAVYATYKDLK